MCNSIKLKIDKDEAIDKINKLIILMNNAKDIEEIKKVLKTVIDKCKEIIHSQEVIEKLKTKVYYQENGYSTQRTTENILKATENTIEYLKELVEDICHQERIVDGHCKLKKEEEIYIVEKMLNNFYLHIETMYQQPVNGKAGITKEKLDQIKIKNEYDVQRILYSLIKPVFPEARVEVVDDTGFASIRYDIIIERLSLVIEVKCSRASMSQRNLTEEIGSDIFHYNYNNLFFFIYDKEKIITDITSFRNTYNTKIDSKDIKTIVIQPITL